MIYSVVSYCSVVYLLFLLTNIFFLFSVSTWDLPTTILTVLAALFYPLLETAPAIVGGIATYLLKVNKVITGIVLFLLVAPLHLILLFDAGLYYRYGYHINMHIINIFTTPGGFEAMGMKSNEILTLVIGVIVFLFFHASLVFVFLRYKKLSFPNKLFTIHNGIIAASAFVLIFVCKFFIYSYSHYKMNPTPLLAAEAMPLYISGTSGSFFKKLGIKQPSRDAVRLKLQKNVSSLDKYPQKEIVREGQKKYNVVWIACESWAHRMFTPEIMPRTTAFSKRCVYFQNHYSGGNVTRQGVFSMFYGLPGNYWKSFLSARRGPLIIDWMLEDGYNLDCFTSAKFTYPEFDQTVFFNVPTANMISDSQGKTWQRDQRNTERFLANIDKRSKENKPFFAFFFLESPHHPYDFPDEAIIYKDYLNPFNAAEVTSKDKECIIKRAANACHHLDMCLGKIFQHLEKQDLLKNTIVVVAGDHDEEYFEKGYLGHSSKFVNEQTKTTLLIYYPGVKPEVYKDMSSHLDIVPILSKFFGVKNDPSDYSCGLDLLAAPRKERNYCLIANWDDVFFVGKKYKSLLPLEAEDFAKQTITDSEDRKLDDVDLFYKEYNKTLIQVQKDLTRFTAPL